MGLHGPSYSWSMAKMVLKHGVCYILSLRLNEEGSRHNRTSLDFLDPTKQHSTFLLGDPFETSRYAVVEFSKRSWDVNISNR